MLSAKTPIVEKPSIDRIMTTIEVMKMLKTFKMDLLGGYKPYITWEADFIFRPVFRGLYLFCRETVFFPMVFAMTLSLMIMTTPS